jgi:ankyrin repeat protein
MFILIHGFNSNPLTLCIHGFLASSNGHSETVSILLARGANHNNKNRKGMSALLLAVKEGHWNIVERLIQSGVDLEQTDVNGRNSLMIAAEEGHVAIMELLLNKGADHSVADKDGWVKMTSLI